MRHPRSLYARFIRRWSRNHDVKILGGEGAGLRFKVGPADPAYAMGTNELPVQAALRDHVRPGEAVYDIGANVGFFSVILARLVGKQGVVYAFEPLPANLALLRHNLRINDLVQVQVFEYAVSGQSGFGELFVAAYSGGSALATAGAPPDQIGSMPIEMVALDDLIPRRSLRAPSLVKIDVEGAELDVLHGMSHTLEKHQPMVLYELDAATQADLQEKHRAIRAYFLDRGYNLTLLPPSYSDSAWQVLHVIASPNRTVGDA